MKNRSTIILIIGVIVAILISRDQIGNISDRMNSTMIQDSDYQQNSELKPMRHFFPNKRSLKKKKVII